VIAVRCSDFGFEASLATELARSHNRVHTQHSDKFSLNSFQVPSGKHSSLQSATKRSVALCNELHFPDDCAT